MKDMDDEINALRYKIGILKGKITQKDRKIDKLEKQLSEMKVLKRSFSKNSKEELSCMVLDLQRENYMLRHRLGKMEIERFIEKETKGDDK